MPVTCIQDVKDMTIALEQNLAKDGRLGQAVITNWRLFEDAD
jgi:hypothetical protein